MTEDGKTIAEVARSVDRIEAVLIKLGRDMQESLGPIAINALEIKQINKHLESTDAHVETIDKKVDRIIVRAAYISGGVAAAAWIVSVILRHS